MKDSDDRTEEAPVSGTPLNPETLLTLGLECSKDSLEELRRHPVEEIARVLRNVALDLRVTFLETADRVDEIVPLLPEAEFTQMIRSYGIEESGWLVEFASTEQRVAAIDLDCWRGSRFSASRFFEWVDAMIEAGPETLAASFSEIDDEIWRLAMRAMGEFEIMSGGTNEFGGSGATIDGLVYYDAKSAESEDRIREILTAALQYSPTHYWSLVYGALSQTDPLSDELAARWHSNRLNDLGFPDLERANIVRSPLRVGSVSAFETQSGQQEIEASLFAASSIERMSGNLLGAAIAELPPERANEAMQALFSIANALAVADQLTLSDPSNAERTLGQAWKGVERGLAAVARKRNRSLGQILDSAVLLDLFRMGSSVDCDSPSTPEAKKQGSPHVQTDEDSDWNIIMEEID